MTFFELLSIVSDIQQCFAILPTLAFSALCTSCQNSLDKTKLLMCSAKVPERVSVSASVR